MKALVIEAPGTVRLREIPEPPLPEGECRVAVTLAGICRTDLELARGYMGFTGVPGHEFVGVVTAGSASLKGKRVVGEINVPEPGPEDGGQRPRVEDPRHHVPRSVLGILGRQGAFAESLTLPPENLLVVPDSVPDDVAVFTEPLAAAMQILEQLDLPHGQRALVIGDGKLGLLVAQVLKVHGADVTLRGRHAWKLSLAKGWGVRTESAVPRQEPESPFSKPTLEAFHKILHKDAFQPMLEEFGSRIPELKAVAPSPEKLALYRRILDAMTVEERGGSAGFDHDAVRRIANGSGSTVPEVEELLANFGRLHALLDKIRERNRAPASDTQPFPLVVEATGSPDGFKEALKRVAPRGTVILKSTYAPGELPELDAAKVVVDEIRIQGSRCGRFAPALKWLAEGKVDVRGLIETLMPLAQGEEAFALAARRGVKKVLLEIGG